MTRQFRLPSLTFASFIASLALALVGGLTSCASGPPKLPESLSPSELIQRAQEASDKGDYPSAIHIYKTAEERFGSDALVLATSEYEIAFMLYKQGKYAESQALFEKLLALYASPGAEALPPRFKILAEKILLKVKEAQNIKP